MAYEVLDYSTKNDKEVGYGGKRTLSIELEMSSINEDMITYLVEKGYIATRDGSVAIECKSPIFKSVGLLEKSLREFFDKFHFTTSGVGNTYSEYFDETTGCHLNIGGEKITRQTMDLIIYHYNNLFTPLSKMLLFHPEVSDYLFGRRFNSYAKAICEDDYVANKYSFINVAHDKWVEFRLPKINNYRQYSHAIRCCSGIMDIIEKELIDKNKDGELVGKMIRQFVRDYAVKNKLVKPFSPSKIKVYAQKNTYFSEDGTIQATVDYSEVSWAYWTTSLKEAEIDTSMFKSIIKRKGVPLFLKKEGIEVIEKEIEENDIIGKKGSSYFYLRNGKSWRSFYDCPERLNEISNEYLMISYDKANKECTDKEFLKAWRKEIERRLAIQYPEDTGEI